MSIITNFLGLNPTGPTATKKKNPKALGRLSLAQLTSQLKDLQAASDIGAGKVKSDRQKIDPATGLLIEPDTGKDPGVGSLKFKRAKSDLFLTAAQAFEQKQKGIAGRLKKLGAARKQLITRVTGARTQRATSISTLLGRGI